MLLCCWILTVTSDKYSLENRPEFALVEDLPLTSWRTPDKPLTANVPQCPRQKCHGKSYPAVLLLL